MAGTKNRLTQAVSLNVRSSVRLLLLRRLWVGVVLRTGLIAGVNPRASIIQRAQQVGFALLPSR